MHRAVIFDKGLFWPICCSEEVPRRIIDTWIPRANQIAMVEAIALPVAAETFKDVLKGKRVLWMLDSDSVFGAMVKGYSDRMDICSTAAIFWEQMR